MSSCTLGTLEFRLNPNDFSINYSIDYKIINTIGGQVVQVFGSTTSDLVIKGSFGQKHGSQVDSWQLAESFHKKIRSMMDEQTSIANPKNYMASQQHKPFKFTFFDGENNLDFDVLIKSITDPDGDAIKHSNGKFSHEYVLTLFVVNDESQVINKIASDAFIESFSGGIGWTRTLFNGSMGAAEAIAYISNNSPDNPTLTGYLAKILGGSGA